MSRSKEYRELVRQIALDHYGYISTAKASRAGIPAVELNRLAVRGGLTSIAYGLYRLPDVEPTPYDRVAEALLYAGEGSCVRGESVLALVGLPDIHPDRIQVAAPRRSRRVMPEFMNLTYVKNGIRTVTYNGLPALHS